MFERPANLSKDSADPPVDKAVPATCRESFITQAVEDYQSALIAYANSLLKNPDLARDVVQDTFIRLCDQEISKVETHLKSWLFTVCRNRAFDHLRKDSRSQPLEEFHQRTIATAELQPDESAEQDERISQLTRCLNRLTDNRREVIMLKFQQGLSYLEIATITGLSPSNVGFLIHSGLKQLREFLPEDLRNP